jgi:hypothetical protein
MSVSTWLFAMSLQPDQIQARRHRLQHVEIYEVAADELDRIEQESTNVGTDLQFATFWFPIGITLTIVLATTPIPSQGFHTGFMVGCFMGYGFGLYFAVRWWKQRSGLKKLVARIRERQVGPLGEEGEELRPSELASLPAQQVGPIQLAVEAVDSVQTPGIEEIKG